MAEPERERSAGDAARPLGSRALRRILCATDVTSGAERALAHALALARSWGAEQVRIVRARAPAIVRAAEEVGADAIVFETHVRTRLERVFGDSIAEDVIRTSPVPVLTVPRTARSEERPRLPTSILCAIDLSTDADAVLEHGVKLARIAGAALHVVHVWQLTDELQAHDLLDELGERIRAHAAQGVSVTAHLRNGRPAAEIVDLAIELEASRIVMATEGRRGLPHLLGGSVAEEVVRTSPVPVWTVQTRT